MLPVPVILRGSRADYNKVGVRGGAPPCYRRQHPRLETIGNSPSSSGFHLGIPPGEDGSRRLRPTRQPWSSRTAGAVDRTPDRVSTNWWVDGRAFIGGTASGGSAGIIRLNYWAGSSVFICRGLGLHEAHRCKAGQDMSSQTMGSARTCLIQGRARARLADDLNGRCRCIQASTLGAEKP